MPHAALDSDAAPLLSLALARGAGRCAALAGREADEARLQPTARLRESAGCARSALVRSSLSGRRFGTPRLPAFAQSGAGAGAGDSALGQYAPAQQSPPGRHRGRARRYMAGKGSFDEADYTTAINYFKDAYRRDCTKHELLVIIARAYELHGNRREAIHALETYLERMPSAPDAEVQRRHIANLKREISSSRRRAHRRARRRRRPLPQRARRSLPWRPLRRPGSVASPPPPPGPTGGHTAGPWVLVVAGGVATIAGGVLFGVGTSQVSSAETVCGASHDNCPPGSSSISQGTPGARGERGGPVAVVGLAAVVGADLALRRAHRGRQADRSRGRLVLAAGRRWLRGRGVGRRVLIQATPPLPFRVGTEKSRARSLVHSAIELGVEGVSELLLRHDFVDAADGERISLPWRGRCASRTARRDLGRASRRGRRAARGRRSRRGDRRARAGGERRGRPPARRASARATSARARARWPPASAPLRRARAPTFPQIATGRSARGPPRRHPCPRGSRASSRPGEARAPW